MKILIKNIIQNSIKKLQKEENLLLSRLPGIVVDQPKEEKFGDYTTNVALVLAPVLKKSPMIIADEIIKRFDLPARNASHIEAGGSRPKRPKEVEPLSCIFDKIEAVEPGYINFYLSEKYLHRIVAEINRKTQKFGNSQLGKGVKINNEFISANPTGPLHLGNGRGGFYGDVLSNVLAKAGYKVTKEYYINDAGEQVLKLGHSVLKDKEAVYAGDYINKLNKNLKNLRDARIVGEKAAAFIMKEIIRPTVKEKMKIKVDIWISEKNDLYKKGLVDKAIGILKKKKLTYEKDGALWLATTKFSDDKDRVLIKSVGSFGGSTSKGRLNLPGEKTYFASDCGYILHKMERGYDCLIEIWGADHHGYVKRFEAAAKALGFKGKLKFIIVQMVRLVEKGKEVRMSKRAGNVVYINELIDKVGLDATRFFFLMYAPDTHMNFDLALAKERSQKNPVYYVQYACARISSILAKNQKSKIKNQNFRTDLSLLNHKKELNLIRELNKFSDLISEIAQSYDVHKLPHYAVRLADKFHDFYESCRVIDAENPELTRARLMLINAVRIVLAETLRLMGVNAPEKM